MKQTIFYKKLNNLCSYLQPKSHLDKSIHSSLKFTKTQLGTCGTFLYTLFHEWRGQFGMNPKRSKSSSSFAWFAAFGIGAEFAMFFDKHRRDGKCYSGTSYAIWSSNFRHDAIFFLNILSRRRFKYLKASYFFFWRDASYWKTLSHFCG